MKKMDFLYQNNVLNNISYDIRQEINNKPIGVLKYNNSIREKLLKRNIGKYPLLDLNEGIGYISNLYSNETSKPFSFGEEGLLGLTHIYQSDYQKSINNKYDIGDIIRYYNNNLTPDVKSSKWNGLYDNYVEYIDKIFGLPITSLNLLSSLFEPNKLKDSKGIFKTDNFLTIQSILCDFLQYDNLKYSMEKTRIGTVTPNPLGALAGSITTNINNFSGTDTSLGLITNHLYAHTLKNSAQFNTLRKTQYITPDVYNQLGLKLSTISTISSDFRIDDETGRLAYELNKGLNVTKNYYDFNEIEKLKIDDKKDISNSDNARYINISRNKYKPLKSEENFYNDSVSNVKHILRFNPKNGNRVYYNWNEGDKRGSSDNVFSYYNNNGYSGINEKELKDGLLSTTNELFKLHNEKGIDTLIGRFHTSGGRDKTHNEASLLQTAISEFGMSHGRNLLTKKAYEQGLLSKDENQYENPYCRAWTYHNQYGKIRDLIRPFSNDKGIISVDELQENWWMYGRTKDGSKRLKDNSVLNSNGFVNITPSKNNGNDNLDVDITKCMFSIENLAWKDITNGYNKNILSKEQIGPNGGRIMWFPPYDLKFNEQVQADWNPNSFIGRGEKIYTYTDTERSGTLSFVLLVDHPSILDIWKNNSSNTYTNDDEQKILRFFAGCDTLELNNIEIHETEDEIEQGMLDEIIITPNNDESNTSKDIIFYVFFPNNFSGNDDINESIDYLINNYESTNGGKYAYNDYKWEYKVDNKYLIEKHKKNSKGGLEYEINYKDNNNFHLNNNLDSVKNSSDFSDATNTFYEIINNFNNVIGNRIITKALVKSYASNHGKSTDNKILYTSRYNFISSLLKERGITNTVEKLDKDSNIIGEEIKVKTIDNDNISGESSKRARCAKIVLKTINKPVIEDLSNITYDKTENDEVVVNENKEIPLYTGVYSNDKKSKRALRKNKRNSINDKTNHDNIQNDIIKQLRSINTDLLDVESTLNNVTEKNVIQQLNSTLRKTMIINGKKDELLKNMEDKRWDEEAQYFSMLQDNDSLLYNRIVDKIKYFTPAFHSITPEGFNARLSFLHQCTRQGYTSGLSDVSNKDSNIIYRNAGNLAFGRPPVCVLRIGDFYYTKIIINNLTIDYDNPQWDMNPEGIGMQPMFAKISINFKFLGGSDIEAPISRLQNAISFNYYANQSIYDDRADTGTYDIENKKAIIKNNGKRL